MVDKAIDHLAKDRAAQLSDALKKELLVIPDQSGPNRIVVRGEGKGKYRYQLKRMGMIGMGHPDGKGRALVWKTPLGRRVAKHIERECGANV
jgi:hypothetical protein